MEVKETNIEEDITPQFNYNGEIGERLKVARTVTTMATLWEDGITEIPMLYEIFPMFGLWFVIGASDVGKSLFLRQLAMCVSGGKSFLRRKFNGKYMVAIYVSSEDDSISFSVISKKQNKTIQLTKEDAQRLFCHFDTLDLVNYLDDLLNDYPADLIILDAFGDMFNNKDINQNNQVRQFLQPFVAIAEKHRCSVGMLHHTSKRSEELEPNKNNAIGSQGIEAKARFVAELRLDKNNPALRHLCIVKGNYLPAEEKTKSYVLEMDENLCFDFTGDRVDFKDLIATEKKSKNTNTNPTTFSDKTHIDFLRKTFENFKVYSKNQLGDKIMTRFYVSDKTAREFIRHYERKEWIECIVINSKKIECRLILEQGKLW